MIAILFGLFFFLMFANIPVFVALTASSAVVMDMFTNLPPEMVIQRMFAGINKFSLMAVPFFIFAANVMNRGGLAPRLLDFCNALVGHKRSHLYVPRCCQRQCACHRGCHLLYHASCNGEWRLWQRILCGPHYGSSFGCGHHSAQYWYDYLRHGDKYVHW